VARPADPARPRWPRLRDRRCFAHKAHRFFACPPTSCASRSGRGETNPLGALSCRRLANAMYTPHLRISASPHLRISALERALHPFDLSPRDPELRGHFAPRAHRRSDVVSRHLGGTRTRALRRPRCLPRAFFARYAETTAGLRGPSARDRVGAAGWPCVHDAARHCGSAKVLPRSFPANLAEIAAVSRALPHAPRRSLP
jgi:hypothetical protein